jgi:transcriptional regulator with XRE-family HTH domain
MTEQHAPEAGTVPPWDTADRMRKALRTSGMSIEEMADYLDVSKRSIGNWIGGRVEPRPYTLRLWALKTGTPYTWLCHGDLNPCDLRPRGEPAPVFAGQRSVTRRPNNMHYSRTCKAA